MMNRVTIKAVTICAVASLFGSTPSVAQIQIGPASKLYATAGDQDTLLCMQGTAAATAPLQTQYVRPLYVRGKIATVAYLNGRDGAGYDLALNPNGKTYTNAMGASAIADVTTDGTFIYGLNGDTGEVIRARLNWSNPQVLFTLGDANEYNGITYDPSNHSLWVSGWLQSKIENYDMQGNYLSGFNTSPNWLGSIALDHVDGTLWCTSWGGNDNSVLLQYTKDGQSLQQKDYGLQAFDILSSEFDIGAPAKVKRVTVRRGEYIRGTFGDLKNSDRKRYRIRSEPGSGDRQRMECDIVFKSEVPNAWALDVVVESRLNTAGGTARVFVRNWDTGEFDRFETYNLLTEENRITVYNLRASKYMSPNGRIIVRLRHTTDTPGPEWKSFLNVVQARVRAL